MSWNDTSEPCVQIPTIKREQCAPDPFQIASEAENRYPSSVDEVSTDSRTTIQDLPPEILTSILKSVPGNSTDSVVHATRTLSAHMLDTDVLRHQYLQLLPQRLGQPPFFDPPCLWDTDVVPTHRVCDACDMLKPLSLYVDPKHHYEISSACLSCLAKRRWAQGSPSDDAGEEEGEINAYAVLSEHCSVPSSATTGTCDYWYLCPACKTVKVRKGLTDLQLTDFIKSQEVKTETCVACEREIDQAQIGTGV